MSTSPLNGVCVNTTPSVSAECVWVRNAVTALASNRKNAEAASLPSGPRWYAATQRLNASRRHGSAHKGKLCRADDIIVQFLQQADVTGLEPQKALAQLSRLGF